MRVLTFFILYFLIPVGSLEAQVTSSTLVGLNIGNIAPELDFKNVNDKNIKLSSLRGNVVLIDFYNPLTINPKTIIRWFIEQD